MSSSRDPGELTQFHGHFSWSYVTFSHIMSSTWVPWSLANDITNVDNRVIYSNKSIKKYIAICRQNLGNNNNNK